MDQKRIIKYLLFGILICLMISCEYYLGINQQPEFEDTSMEEGLNIFGILRPDFKADYNKSFVFIQQLWPVLDIEGGYTIIRDVNVKVEHLVNNEVVTVIDFPLVPSDSLFADTLYRPLESFTPQPGGRYRLVCEYEELPNAIGETVFPSQPGIIENSFSLEGRSVSFTLAVDTLIKMIDIYLVGGDYSQNIARIIPYEMDDTEVELSIPIDPQGLQLMIFSYDTNLAVYYGNSNTSLNFNKYRTTISTLDSGYGVFGALNYIIIDL